MIEKRKKKRGKTDYMYGKLQDDTYEIRMFIHGLFEEFYRKYSLSMDAQNELIEIRNAVTACVKSAVGTSKIEDKYGVKVSVHATPGSLEKFIEKQARSSSKKYIPCEICREERITNFCHILPREYGGPDVDENYVYLCPTHHHLFDHNRMNENEWGKLNFSKKMESAQEYVEKVRLPLLKAYWEGREKS